MKRTPLKRSTKPIKRNSRVKNANRRRKAKEFARAYGSRARVAWIKTRVCTAIPFGGCSTGPSDNAHTVTGGMGYKADYWTIVPLCRTHHSAYDQRLGPFGLEWNRETLRQCARFVEEDWQRHINRSETP